MPSRNHILEKVRDFADQAHGEQRRKYSDEPYIVHPVQVMTICTKYTSDLAVLSAALLHDVLEDTVLSKEEMQDFLNTVMDNKKALRTTRLVEELTDVYIKKDFPKLNRKKRKAREAERLAYVSSEAQTIKYADLIDNTENIVVKDPDFAFVFLSESQQLLTKMNKGHQALYQHAVTTIQTYLKRLRMERS